MKMQKLLIPLVRLLWLLQLLLILSPAFAQNDGIPRGAQLPYVRYESEDAAKGGGATLQSAPTYDQNAIASEASNQKYVSLSGNGQYVEWTASTAFQAVNLRFTMPDNASGTGLTGSLALYVNGTRVKTIDLSSYWAYQYFPGGATEPVQTPGGKTFMRFDEVHFKLDNSVSQGSTVRIIKENGDALTYGVDFLELEPLPVAVAAPAGALVVTSFGAVANDQVDDFAAFNQCIAAAASQGKAVYIPEGRFLLSDKLPLNVNNMKIQGAGIWRTEIYFSTNKQFYGGIFARASNVEISDFSLNTANNGRFKYDEQNARVPAEIYKIYKGFMGTYGTSSRIHDVWVEHFECGMWIAGYDPPYPIDITTDLIVTRARIRNNYADGVNFCQGTNNSVVEYSSVRNEGDDGLAMWPNDFQSAPQEVNNIFRYCTIENTWRAGGVAIFGGSGHQIYRCIIKDGVGGSAIRFTNDFPGHKFDQASPKIIATDNYIVSCGTSYDLWDRRRGAIELNTPQGIYDVEFNNTKIINSQRHAIQLVGSIQNMVFNNTTIDGTGMDAYVDQPTMDDWGGFGLEAQANGVMTFNNVSFNNIESYKTGTDPVLGNIKNHNTGFIININNTNIPLTGITLSPASVSLPEGKVQQLSVTFNPTNATNKTINWSTSNAAVATVTGTGTGIADVTAKAIGTATITATSVDGSFVKTCTVSVTPAVNITATDASAGEGGNVGVFTISTSAVTANITVPYVISGSASSADYSPALSGSVTLTPASPSATITITPVDDTAFEGVETLTLTLQSGTGYSLGGSTAATVSITDNDNPPCTAPIIGFTATAPVIDQSIDAAWNAVPSGTIGNVTFGSMPADFAGSKWRAMYDNTNLYLLVEVKDNNKFNDSGTSWWEDDVVEIFIDGDNSKGTSYDGINDFQLGFRYNDTNINVGGGSVTRTTGITFTTQNVTGGYNLEVRIPWSTIGVSAAIGNRIGLDVEVDDDDNGGARDSQVSAFATTSMAWSNPSLFGSVYLTSCSSGNVAVTSVSVSPTTASVNTGSTQQLTATIAPANATNQTVSWSSSNTAVATVTAGGLVTAVAPGTSTITVTTQDGAKTATSTITVSNVAVTGVTASPTTASLSVAATQQLTATITPSNATNKNVTWSSGNTAVATVNASGLVTAVAAGSVTITVTTQDGSKTATSSITVTTANVAVTSVAVSPTTASIVVGATQQLTATIAPSNATNKNVTWSSGNTAVATVNATGLVTAVAAGSATITVTTQDGGKTATSAITVTAANVAVTGVSVSPTAASLAVAATQQLTATVAPANATNKNVTWSSSNTSVATVNASGLVTAVAAGSATITVTTQDGAKTATSAITVTSTTQAPFGGTAWAIPGTIEVENFDTGGEGIAYHDNDATNSGGQGRTSDGVDTETCSEGGLNIGWTNTGEWMEYTVNVGTAGSYNVDVRTASSLAGGTFHIEFNGVDKTGLFTTVNTGAWQTWTTISKTGISLNAGIQVMRIYLDNANFNLNKVTFSTGTPAGTITCYKSTGAITVNGTLSESSWNIVTPVSKATVGATNNTATFGVLWDNTNLYIGAKVLDASLNNDSANPWDNDAVEIYIDANNNKLGSYDGLDNQIIKGYNTTTLYTKVAISGAQHSWAAISGGYSIEVAIPWSQLGITPANGVTIGFDLGYDDDDDSGARDSQGVWNGTVNNYASTAGFGSLVLNSSNSPVGRLATEEVSDDLQLSIYPNPVANGVINISSEGKNETMHVTIFDNTGRLIQQKSGESRGMSVDVSGASRGLLFVKALKGGQQIVRKIIVE